jgi:hypothetical protein
MIAHIEILHFGAYESRRHENQNTRTKEDEEEASGQAEIGRKKRDEPTASITPLTSYPGTNGA